MEREDNIKKRFYKGRKGAMIYDRAGLQKEIINLLSENYIPTWIAKDLLKELYENLDQYTIVSTKTGGGK